MFERERGRERKIYLLENVKVIPANVEPYYILLGQAHTQVLVFYFRVF